jgi:hypothetical protein
MKKRLPKKNILIAMAILMVTLILFNLFAPGVIINRFFIGKISLTIILILNATMASIVFRYYLRPYFEAANLAEDIAEGKTPGSLKRESEISRHLKKIHENLLDVTAFIETVGKSENQVNLKSLKPDEGLGKSLIEMQSKLNELSKEERTRNWKNHGVAEIGDMLRKRKFRTNS